MSASSESDRRVAFQSGLYAVAAFTLWGLLPLYWKLLKDIAAPALLAHRIIWSTLFYLGAVLSLGLLRDVAAVFRSSRHEIKKIVAAGLLVGGNWLVYIYAINTNRVLEASLGYFLNPLVSIFLGFLVLGERLGRLQWVAVGLAALGVASVAYLGGHGVPWISLALALSFGSYALVKKRTGIPLSVFSFLETVMLFIPALAYLFWFDPRSSGYTASWGTLLLLMASGALTGIPLLLFARAIGNLKFSTLGFLQYVTPTCQFLLAVFLYHEPFDGARLAGFSAIWAAIAIYLVTLRR